MAANLQREVDRMLLVDSATIDDTVHIKRVADAPPWCPHGRWLPAVAEPVARRDRRPPRCRPAVRPSATGVSAARRRPRWSTARPRASVAAAYADLADDETIDDVCRRVIDQLGQERDPAAGQQLRDGQAQHPG